MKFAPRCGILLSFYALILLLTNFAYAGPALDEILNTIYLDQSTPMDQEETLFRFEQRKVISRAYSYGQVFVTGPDTEKIARIRVYLEPNNQWQPGEGARMDLWDSPQKKTLLGSYTVMYDFRGYINSQADFEVNATVKPNSIYFFEISYVGAPENDGTMSRVGVLTGSLNYQITHRTLFVREDAPDGGDGFSWDTAFNSIQSAMEAAGNLLEGQGYTNGTIAGYDISFQTHVKKRYNRVANLKKMFGRFNLTRPELAEIKQAVDRQDFEKAIAKTVYHFEHRTFPPPLIDPSTVPVINPAFDTTEAENAMQNFYFADGMYKYAGPDMNWRSSPSFDANGKLTITDWALNRFQPRGALSKGYLNTGNHKYAKKLNDILLDWYRDNPPPKEAGFGGTGGDTVWASLEAGIRLGQTPIAYDRIHSSPEFTNDCRMATIIDMANHADTLIWNGGNAGGNWAITQNSSLISFALDYPEFKNSGLWFDISAERINGVFLRDFLPDGVESESAPGYQRNMVYWPLVDVYKLLLSRGVQTVFFNDMKAKLEKFAEYFMHLEMPGAGVGGQGAGTPNFGDYGDGGRAGIVEDSVLYNRPDMLWVGTGGQQGTPPSDLSKCFPYAGTVTLRSDWGNKGQPFEDARYLFLHGVHRGAHGHSDLNGVVVHAYGREILTDPGAYIYGSPAHVLLTSSVSHNLMTIDGQDQNSHSDVPFRAWGTTPVADYLSSRLPSYNAGYYHREVFYIRANDVPGAKDYWLIRDKAEGGGTHSMEQRWHFNPGPLNVDATTLTTSSATENEGNLAIMQVNPSRLQIEQTTIDTWRPRVDTTPTKLPTVIYKITTALPAAMDTVLLPFDGAQMPGMSIVPIETSGDGLDSVFKVVQGNVEDLFILQRSSTSKTVAAENVTFNGERLIARRVGGVLKSVVLTNGRSATVDGREIVNSTTTMQWYMVSFDASGDHVYTSPN
ncbi:MAG: heparinase II/III family protein [Armatimonadota bacterium]|nr:heparinase II/III family protein [Armatimonadota bacterium]